MANLTSDVLSAVVQGKSRAPEIADFILGNVNSVRSALARLSQRGEIVRISRGKYAIPAIAPPPFLFKHFLADTKYNRGIGVTIFTTEETDEELTLIEAMATQVEENFALSFGYSREQVNNTGQVIDRVEFVGIDGR